MGSNFANGKGNATIFFQYQNTAAVLQSKYNYSACSFGSTGDPEDSRLLCLGSSTANPGRFIAANGPKAGASITIANAAGDARPFSSALDQFNFQPYNYYQRPQEDYQANAFAHYDLFAGDDKKWMPSVRVYAEFDFTSTTSVAQVAPGGIFLGQFDPLTNDNPLLSQSFKDAFGISAGTPVTPLIGRRNSEGGGRQDNFSFSDYRYVLGAKGDFANHTWDYDFWWQSGKNTLDRVQANYFASDRIQKALNVVTDPTTGRPACASFVDQTDLNCVPYDIYHNGGVTPAALNYLSAIGIQTGYTQQNIVGLHLTSDLGAAYGWTLPWAKNGVGVAFGYEHRTDRLQNVPDVNLSTNNLSGQGGATLFIQGQVTVDEVFAEAKVPIAERQDYAYLLQFDGSYRYSDYSNGPQTNSFGLGLEWAPIKGYTLRGSYQQAIRAANIIELFQQQGTNLFGGSDPCAGPKPTASLEACLRTGLPANLYGNTLLTSPAGQYNYLQGGNPDLTPEKSESYTIGMVFDQPSNIRGFSATIDYWNIKVKNNIGIVLAQDQLTQCITTGAFCNNIHRDNLGTLWLDGGGFITATNQNLGTTSTSGIDLTANYTWPIQDWGSLGFTFQGTYVDTFVNQPLPNGPTYDCAGLYGLVCGTPIPRWRSNVGVIWSTPWHVDAGLRWRYFDSVKVDATSSNPSLANNVTVEPAITPLGARNYLDLFATWQIDKNWLVRVGVNNVLDKDPPITSGTLADASIFGNGNTFPTVYDSLGRLFFLNVTAKF